MELQRFTTLADATARYRSRLAQSPSAVDELFLAICEGNDERAEALYATVEFPSRWWADITYMQGHYLLRLRKRDRLFDLVRNRCPGLDLPAASEDPLNDIGAMCQRIETASVDSGASRRQAAVLHCILGHARLAMDYHEVADAAYRRAMGFDLDVSVPWENMSLTQFVRQELSLRSIRYR